MRNARPLEVIEEEDNYLKSVERISHQAKKDEKATGFFAGLNSMAFPCSTKESSENSQEPDNAKIFH